MKKILVVLSVVLCTMSAKAQWFDFSNNSNQFGLGFHAGQSAHGTEYAGLGFGIGVSVYGVYVDCIIDDAEHKFDNHVTNTLYHDSASYSINLGYQIPVLKWLRVMPLVGYSQTNYGITDATTVNIETGENTSSIYHDYDVTHGSRKHYVNFGVGLFLKPIRWVDLYAVASRNAIYGGISLNLAEFGNRIE